MSQRGLRWCLLLFVLLLGLTVTTSAAPQGVPANAPPPPAPARSAPRLEPVAETRLLMEGLDLANFRGLDRQLKQKPADVEAWTFARGQALLLAESANLLLIRPPKNQGQDAWMTRSSELRDAATTLARHLANRDYERSRAGLAEVANACTRCHQTFRVPVQVVPFTEPEKQP
jgi:cytochrome c553